MNISSIRWSVVVVALLALAAGSRGQEDEYDDAPAPAKPLRPSPLLRQSRGPVIGRPGSKAAVTPKPTTEAAPVEYEDEEGGEEELSPVEDEAPVTTTTEAPKKTGVRTGVVRPFRSNADLIETLKRRRQQHGSHATHNSAPASTTAVAPTPAASADKGFKGGRRAPSSGNRIAAADQTSSTSERKSTVNGRRFNARGGNSAPSPAEVTEEVEEQPKPTRLFGRSRRV